jgi:hypothetical protein
LCFLFSIYRTEDIAMTDTCTTPLVGRQDNVGSGTPPGCTRGLCGLMIERFEDSGEKGIRISVVVETFRALYYWAFLAVLGTGIFLTAMFVTIDHTAIVKEVFGEYNICANLDFPPSTYVLPFLYLFPLAFGIIYSSVSMFRIWISYEEGRITVLEKRLLWAVHVYFILSTMWFEMIFAVSPDLDEPTTIIIHTVPYMNLKVAMLFLQIAVVHFGARVAWKDLKYAGTWFVVISWIHVALQCMAMLIPNMMMLNALLDVGKGRWWNVHDHGYSYSKPLYYLAEIFGKSYTEIFLVFIFPLFQSHLLACHGFRTHCVTFQITDNKESRINEEYNKEFRERKYEK